MPERARRTAAPTVLHVTTVPDSLVFLRGQPGFMRMRGLTTVVASSPGAALQAFGAGERVATYAVPMARAITPLADVRAVLRLARVVRQVRPAILHAHTPKGGLVGMLAGILTGVRWRVYHMRGFPAETAAGWRRRLLLTAERITCACAHRVVCVSDSLRRTALAAAVAPADKLLVLGQGSGQGVDARGRFTPESAAAGGARIRLALGIPPAAPVVGYIGRLAREKGIEELAGAWERVRTRCDDASLLVIGAADVREPVGEELIARLRADPRVHLVRQTDDVVAHLGAMSVLALPTYREGLPNVLLEAAAVGLPVVATAVTGCVDVVASGQTGLLVPPRDTAALAEALLELLDDPPRRRAMGRRARAHVLANFDPQRIFAALYELYLEGLGAEVAGPTRGEPRARVGSHRERLRARAVRRGG